MPFHEIDRPEPSKMVEPSPAQVVVPPLQLFRNELAFWRTRRNEADRAGDAVTRRIAEVTAQELRRAAVDRSAVEVMSTQGFRADIVESWLKDSILAVSYARLLREIDQLPGRETFGFSFSNPHVALAVDFHAEDIYRSGVHATPECMRRSFEMEPPKPRETRYYEGDAIYLRATNPANPTKAFVEDFQGFYGEPFNPGNYVSIVSRLKTEFWTPEH